MSNKIEVLLCSKDERKLAAWQETLDAIAVCHHSLPEQPAEGPTAPEIVLTDQLPLPEPRELGAAQLAAGEVGIIGIGTPAMADVVLPASCTVREIQLTTQLLSEVVRLRRQLAEEKRSARTLRKMAYRDPLTGLSNRRRWDQQLARRLEELSRAQPPLTLGIVFIDLDDFKLINDREGHVRGDVLLARIAHKLAAAVHEPHLAARVGGDEFGVLLWGLAASDVADVAETVRSAAQYRGGSAEEDLPTVESSAGVVIVPAGRRALPRRVLGSADQALQAAKAGGGKRTETKTLEDFAQEANPEPEPQSGGEFGEAS